MPAEEANRHAPSFSLVLNQIGQKVVLVFRWRDSLTSSIGE